MIHKLNKKKETLYPMVIDTLEKNEAEKGHQVVGTALVSRVVWDGHTEEMTSESRLRG